MWYTISVQCRCALGAARLLGAVSGCGGSLSDSGAASGRAGGVSARLIGAAAHLERMAGRERDGLRKVKTAKQSHFCRPRKSWAGRTANCETKPFAQHGCTSGAARMLGAVSSCGGSLSDSGAPWGRAGGATGRLIGAAAHLERMAGGARGGLGKVKTAKQSHFCRPRKSWAGRTANCETKPFAQPGCTSGAARLLDAVSSCGGSLSDSGAASGRAGGVSARLIGAAAHLERMAGRERDGLRKVKTAKQSHFCCPRKSWAGRTANCETKPFAQHGCTSAVARLLGAVSSRRA